DRSFLGTCDMGLKFNCIYFGLEVDGEVVSAQAHYRGKTRQGAWGRYLTFHFAYTLFGMRRLGYGGTLLRWVEGWARREGMDRIKSLIGSYGGFRLHWAPGHEIWGLYAGRKADNKGCLEVDSPLEAWKPERREGWPDGVPKKVRDVCKAVADK